MNTYRQISDDLYWVGGSDRRLALFENIHPLTRGVSYNSYLILDEQTVLVDTADWAVGRQFLENVRSLLDGRELDFLVLNHVEPDHAAMLEEVLLRWPGVTVVTSAPAATFLRQFGFTLPEGRVKTVSEGDSLTTGRHTLQFYAAPMVHWPEVIVTYDALSGALFSADAFGTFRALDGKLFADEFDFDREFLDEARRYYANIVGKFGTQVQGVLGKLKDLPIRFLCPLHGPVWRKDLSYILSKYDLWSTDTPEEQGVLVIYGSMYGNTEAAAEALCGKLAQRGVTNTQLYDVSSTHVGTLISEIFKYSHLVLASVTYNLGIFPPVHDLLADMQALKVQKRTCAIIENGTWAIRSGALIREELGKLQDMTILEPTVTLKSSMPQERAHELDALADALAASLKQ